MSEEDKKPQEENDIAKAGFRSPYASGSDQRTSYPFFLTCSEVDFNATVSAVDDKIEELTGRVRVEESDVTKAKLREELENLKAYRQHVIYVSNGHFSAPEINPFSSLDNWTQAVLNGKKPHGIVPKKINVQKGEDGVIEGPLNVEAMFSKELNVGTPSDVFLPDTGIMVRIGNIQEDELIDLMEQLSIIRSQVGFSHKGSMYTTTDSKIVCAIVEFCLSHVVASSLTETTLENLMSVFRITDANTLAAGTLKSIYPEGYPFLHSCINTDSCTFKTYTDEDLIDGTVATLDYGRIAWYDMNKMTKERLSFVSEPFGTHTVEDVLAHQAEFLKPKTIGPVNETGRNLIKLKVEIPKYLEYRELSFKWIGDIVASVEDVLKVSSTTMAASTVRKNRVDMIREKVFSLRLQRYLPWITEVILTDVESGDPSIARGFDSVKAALGSMSKVNDIKLNAPKIINREIAKLGSSMTGIPMFKCPKCDTVNRSEDIDGKPLSILTRNVIADFFYITELKRVV